MTFLLVKKLYLKVYVLGLLFLSLLLISCELSIERRTLIEEEQQFDKDFYDILPKDFKKLEDMAVINPEKAIERAKKLLADINSVKQIEYTSFFYYVIGRSFSSLDQPLEALFNFNQAKRYLTNTKYYVIKGVYSSYIGNVFFNLNEFTKSKEHYSKAINFFKKSGKLNKITAAESNLALVEKELGNYEQAQKLYENLLGIRIGGDKAFTYILLAELNLISKQHEDSILVWLNSADALLDAHETFEFGKFKGYVNEYSADYYRSRDVIQAQSFYRKSLDWYKPHDLRLWLRASQKMAALEVDLGKMDNAINRMRVVTQNTSEEVSFSLWYDLNAYYAQLLDKSGQTDSAYVVLQQLADKKLKFEGQRAQLSLSMQEFSTQIEDSRITIELQKAQLVRDRYLAGLSILMLATVAIGIYMVKNRQSVIISQRLELEQQRVQLLESRVNESRWRNLRLQLKPHFLYNILSSLQALVHFSPETASRLIEHLAGYFQHILSAESKEMIALSQEMILCKEYLSLQEIRYDGQLQFSLEVDPLAEDVMIPSMIVYPLVENAAKYGYKTTKEGKININVRSIYKSDKQLLVSVENTGKWVTPETSHQTSTLYTGGLGWENIKQRLYTHYGDKASLTHSEKDGMVRVELVLR